MLVRRQAASSTMSTLFVQTDVVDASIAEMVQSMYAFDHNYTELVKNLKERRTEVELALKEPKEQTFRE